MTRGDLSKGITTMQIFLGLFPRKRGNAHYVRIWVSLKGREHQTTPRFMASMYLNHSKDWGYHQLPKISMAPTFEETLILSDSMAIKAKMTHRSMDFWGARWPRNLDLDEAKQRRKWGCSARRFTCWTKPPKIGMKWCEQWDFTTDDGDQNGH